MEFAAGSRVGARGLAWDVVEVAQLGAQQLLRLRCAAGDLRGMEWDILHPAERVEILRADFRPDAPGSLAAWRLHQQACLLEQVLGPEDLLLAEPGRVQIEPYQLVPLMRALELPRPRLLLADGVGLGKTIEAGLIVCELIARRRAHRVLVVSPAGPLLVQWDQELRYRFGLRFAPITDAASLQAQRRRLELGGNPFDAIALCLTSLDFAKQERVLEELERSSWDLAIIDEAHHCISAGASTDRDDTLRRRLAEVIARRSDGLLLLTATPHDGYDAHFSSLIELLDPSLVDGKGALVGTGYRRHVVRRLKLHIRNAVTGEALFRERRVVPVRVEAGGDAAEPVRAFHQALAALIAPRLRRGARIRDHADALAFVSLLKRSGSTIAACVNTLRVVADRYSQLSADEAEADVLRKERARALRAYRKRLLRFGILDAAGETDAADLEADGMAADLHSFGAVELASVTRARRFRTEATLDALDELIRLGVAAEPFDPKLAAVVREVRTIRAEHPATNIIVYTEYADSQLAALSALRATRGIAGEVLAINGLDPETERTRIAERFAERDGIILISTDSLAEGLNLQQRCFNLIHLDLPYNPNRLEQRNGRIDRYGQQHDPQIRYLYLADTFEERLLLRLIAKYEKARAHLTFMPDTLGVTADEGVLSAGLIAGFAERQARLFEDEPLAIRTLDHAAGEANAEAYRDLLHEIDRAFQGYDRSAVRHGWLADHGLNADAAQMRAANTAWRRSDALLGHVDLADFVSCAIETETGNACTRAGVLRIPADWTTGLDDLPGYDAATRTMRITHKRDRLRDGHGRSLAFLGRAHPLVRRAISSVRRIDSAACDNRISAARTGVGAPLSLLFCFSAELQSGRGVDIQHMIAVLVPVSGAAVEIQPPERWLRLADNDREIPSAGLWQDLFAGCAPRCRMDAEGVATKVMQRLAMEFAATRRGATDREAAELERWLRLRADDICGAFFHRTADLFGAVPTDPDWQLLAAPLDRLAAFAADGTNLSARRREADSVVSLFRRRAREREARAALSPPMLVPAGMLMLVPPGCGE
jgi:superfamily II DNA or RNA helicase